MFGLSTLETYLAAAGLTLLGLLAWSAHERMVGEDALKAADAKALVVAEQRAAAETVALQNQVNAAKAEASNAQAQVDQYIAAHPVGSVVCRVTPSGAVSRAPSNSSAANTAGAGSNAVPQVPAGASTTGNISSGLNAIVQAASRLAIIEHEWQQALSAH